jgi:hypothetical protein
MLDEYHTNSCIACYLLFIVINRLENPHNSFRLFYGLFFADTPTEKRRIQSRASSLVKNRTHTLQGNRQTILQRIDIAAVKIEKAPMNVLKRVNAAATHDILQHLRGRVIAGQMQQMNHQMTGHRPPHHGRKPPSMPHSPAPVSLHRASGSFRRGHKHAHAHSMTYLT